MKEYLEIIVAVSLQAYKDLIKGYKMNNQRTITECEKYFTSNCSLFHFLNVDGTKIIKQAREKANYDK